MCGGREVGGSLTLRSWTQRNYRTVVGPPQRTQKNRQKAAEPRQIPKVTWLSQMVWKAVALRRKVQNQEMELRRKVDSARMAHPRWTANWTANSPL